MPGKDPDHWLYRFSADEWLRAAENELGHAAANLKGRQQRAGVASARRAAGMAWNAVLAMSEGDSSSYGRSYMDHLHALAKDQTVPELIRAAAQSLVDAPLTQTLVPLGQGDARLADSARAIVAHVRSLVLPGASA